MTPSAYRSSLPNIRRHSRQQLLFRKWLRWTVAAATYYSGLAFLPRLPGSKPQVRILMYHSIDDDHSYLHSVSPIAFEKQMQFLATKYNVISLNQILEYFDGDRAWPDNPVVITFDDGLANVYTTAYPILKKYKLPATVFLVPDWITSGETRDAKRRHMTWDQIREMSLNKISIGAHTISHRSLPTLTPAQVRSELLESKTRLEQQLCQPIRFFAYPFGAFRDINSAIIQAVQESGYTCAVTSLSGTNRNSTNPYTLRRTEIEVVDGIWLFGKIMTGALDSWIVFQRLRWISQVLRRKNK